MSENQKAVRGSSVPIAVPYLFDSSRPHRVFSTYRREDQPFEQCDCEFLLKFSIFSSEGPGNVLTAPSKSRLFSFWSQFRAAIS